MTTIAWALVLVAAWSNPAAAQVCWAPDIEQVTDTGAGADPHTSKVVTLGWQAYDGSSCHGIDGFDEFVDYRIEVQPSCAGSEDWDPGEGVRVMEIFSISADGATYATWIAEAGQCWAIFPCDDSFPQICLGSDRLNDHALDHLAMTDAEVWMAKGVQYTGTTQRYRVAGTDDPTAEHGGGPDVLRGQYDWNGDQADSLNLFAWDDRCEVYPDDDEIEGVTVRFNQSTSWEDFNTSTFGPEHQLAVSAGDITEECGTSGCADAANWRSVGFPWVIPVTYDDSGHDAILVALQLGTCELDGQGRHGLVLSRDEVAFDLDLECTDAGGCDTWECAYEDECDYANDSGTNNDAVVILDPDADAQGILSYAHGRFVRSFPSNLPVDLCTETLHVVFTGMDGETSSPGSGYTGPWGDIFVWEYTPPDEEEGCSIETVMSGDRWAVVGGPSDPEPFAFNGHDPAVIPTKGNDGAGFARVYVNEWPVGTSRDWTAYYSDDDGVSYFHTSSPQFYFDDGTGEPDYGHPITQWCLSDMAGIAWGHGGLFLYEGLFAVLPGVYDEDQCDSFGDEFTVPPPGILFFELTNG